MNAVSEFLTTKQVAELLRVDIGKVTDWINAGCLTAINVAKTGGGIRPRWRISRDALQQFLQARQSHSPTPSTPRKKPATAGQYY